MNKTSESKMRKVVLLVVLSIITVCVAKSLDTVLKKKARKLARRCKKIYRHDLKDIKWEDQEILRNIEKICDPVNIRQRRYVRDDLKTSEDLTELARSQSNIIDQIVNSHNEEKRFFIDLSNDDACRYLDHTYISHCIYIFISEIGGL